MVACCCAACGSSSLASEDFQPVRVGFNNNGRMIVRRGSHLLNQRRTLVANGLTDPENSLIYYLLFILLIIYNIEYPIIEG